MPPDADPPGPAGRLILDADGRVQAADRDARTLIGGPKAIEGRAIRELLDPLDAPRLPLSTDDEARVLARPTPDGASDRLEVTVTRLPGDPPQRLATLRQPTPDRDPFLDNLPVGVYRTTPDGRVLLVNTALTEMLGQDPEDLRRRDLEEDPFEPDYPREAFRRRLHEEGEVRGLRARWTLPDGEVLVVRESARAVRDEQGRVLYYEGIVEDISDEAEAKRRLSTLVSNLPGVVYRCLNEPDWPMERVAGECEDLTGYPAGAIEDGDPTWAELIHPDDREDVWEDVQAALEAREPFELEYRIQPREGDTVWVWERGRAVRDDDGTVEALEGFISDVTERKRAEDEVRRLNARLERRVQQRTAELEAANRELRGLTRSLSHDLRSPLQTVDGYARVVLEDHDDALDDEAAELLDRVLEATARLDARIDALEALARVTPRTLDPEPVDLSQAARRVLDRLAQRDPDRDVTVHVEDGLAARADPDLAEIALENLLGNAWKFTEGTDPSEIRVEDAGDGALRVTDDGQGLDPDNADRLFEPLHREDPGERQGMGVGLATVRRIAHRHGGSVEADGRPGEGATLTLELEG